MTPPRVKFRLIVHKKGLKDASRVLHRNFKAGLESVGKRLEHSSRARMKRDTGAEEKSLRTEIKGRDLSMNVLVYSTVVQAFVDAYGLPRGTFPNFRVGSKLYGWVQRKLRGQHSKLIVNKGRVPKGLHTNSLHRRARRTRIRSIRLLRKIQSTANGGTTSTKQRNRAKNNDAKRLTFLVARVIYRRGIKGGGWNKKALEANKRFIVKELETAILNSINELKRGT